MDSKILRECNEQLVAAILTAADAIVLKQEISESMYEANLTLLKELKDANQRRTED